MNSTGEGGQHGDARHGENGETGTGFVHGKNLLTNARAPQKLLRSEGRMGAPEPPVLALSVSSLIQTVTVGFGFSPNRPDQGSGSRAVPPVGNFTHPRRSFQWVCVYSWLLYPSVLFSSMENPFSCCSEFTMS